jgi:glutamine synthetase
VNALFPARQEVRPVTQLTPDTDYVLRTVDERGVRFVRLWFVDVLGLLKNIAIPVSELEQALEDGIGLDGSSLESGVRLHERDVIAQPDPQTFAMLPWRPGSLVGRMFCDIRLPDGTPFPGDSRATLRGVVAKAAQLGYSLEVGPEIEFFLLRVAESGDVRPLDAGSYFDLTPEDVASDFRRRSIEYLEEMGMPVKASHHEVGPSQHELDLKHTDALAMADAITTFRLTVKEAAREFGTQATFMPKPFDSLPGSSMHLHLSLFDLGEQRNAFFTDEPHEPLSAVGRAFLAGVLQHARELTAVTNQWVNSYKRLQTGFEAPASISWTRYANGALVRIPSNRPGRESAARIELRSPDPGCNPYLAFALILAAGLRGIERGYELPREVVDLAPPELPLLPRDLREATDAFEASELAHETLGDRLCEWFVRNKRAEWHEYHTTVSDYERSRYLNLL